MRRLLTLIAPDALIAYLSVEEPERPMPQSAGFGRFGQRRGDGHLHLPAQGR